jgi:hypothetical protein
MPNRSATLAQSSGSIASETDTAGAGNDLYLIPPRDLKRLQLARIALAA